jgi:hypothetical protein
MQIFDKLDPSEYGNVVVVPLPEVQSYIYLQSYRINRYFFDHYILLQKLIHKIFTVNFQASLRYSSLFLSNANLTISDVRISPIIVAHSTLEIVPSKLLCGICINMPLKYMTCCLVSIEFRLQMLEHLA